ncbi:MAG: hypothetical protein K2X47_08275 [Bdellovibrionales bacterium]|nr:hypothetical protein [Bdellovibrionales bacterium]
MQALQALIGIGTLIIGFFLGQAVMADQVCGKIPSKAQQILSSLEIESERLMFAKSVRRVHEARERDGQPSLSQRELAGYDMEIRDLGEKVRAAKEELLSQLITAALKFNSKDTRKYMDRMVACDQLSSYLSENDLNRPSVKSRLITKPAKVSEKVSSQGLRVSLRSKSRAR